MRIWWIWLACGLVAGVDALFPLGYAIPLAYIPMVALTLRVEERDWARPVAVLATGLTVIGAALDRVIGPLTPGLFNRGFAIMALWLTAAWVSRYRRLESEVRRHRADAELGRMATIMAHELRNPLGGVTGALQVLHPRLQDSGYQSIIAESLTRLQRVSDLVEALLRFARPVAAAPTPMALGDLFDDLARAMAQDPRCGGPAVDRTVSDGRVLADRHLTVDVLLSLVHNAAHPAVGATQVLLRTVRVDDGWELQVVDNGRGVPVDQRATLGDPFATGRSDRPGLGLAIARRHMEAQGGRLRHTHPADGGTIAAAWLPAATP